VWGLWGLGVNGVMGYEILVYIFLLHPLSDPQTPSTP
jgi:hypothetical protein